MNNDIKEQDYEIIKKMIDTGDFIFKFYDNNLVRLEPIIVMKDHKSGKIVVEFRNEMEEEINELKNLTNEYLKLKERENKT